MNNDDNDFLLQFIKRLLESLELCQDDGSVGLAPDVSKNDCRGVLRNHLSFSPSFLRPNLKCHCFLGFFYLRPICPLGNFGVYFGV